MKFEKTKTKVEGLKILKMSNCKITCKDIFFLNSIDFGFEEIMTKLKYDREL